MLIIPELETVVILVPRTGTGSFYRAVLKKYPKAFMPYRHMEASGVLPGYDRWRRVGVVRHPVDRLWSMYKFCKTFGITDDDEWPDYGKRIRESVDRGFDDWVLNNDEIFSGPGHIDAPNVFIPRFHVNYQIPENRKSQFIYLRPDLGTEVWRFDQMHTLAKRLGVDPGHWNKTEQSRPPILTCEATDHIKAFFAWDLTATR